MGFEPGVVVNSGAKIKRPEQLASQIALAIRSKHALLNALRVSLQKGEAGPMNMQTTAPIALTALAAILLTACERGERAEHSGSPLEGAWSVASIHVTGPDSATHTTVQPSLFLFGDKHYSMMRVTGNGPRTLAATDSATDVEKLAAYNSFIANTGTYEVADSTLTIHPVVARSPNYMGGSDKYHFRASGDTLWLSNTGADIRTRIGGQLVGPTGTPNATMLVLVRQK